MEPTAKEGFFERVYQMVDQVPEGMVATYGQIAKLVGEPRRARYVGYALHVNPRPGIIPCHRIVFADGRLAPRLRLWRPGSAARTAGSRRRELSCRRPRGPVRQPLARRD